MTQIVIIGTLDTKGVEVGLIRDEVIRRGATPIVIDPGTPGVGRPAIPADVTREEVAAASGQDLPALVAAGDKQGCQRAMIDGLVQVVTRLYDDGRVDGIVAVGGAQGTAMATAAMRALPVGIPKVMVSTVACGGTTFGPYVGTKDITMIHSVADILGLNRVTRRILAQAAAAVTAMAAVPPVAELGQELVAITQAGITTPGVMAVKERLEALGFEVIAFHCNGIGGQAMEELILDGVIKGVIDFSPHEITDLLYRWAHAGHARPHGGRRQDGHPAGRGARRHRHPAARLGPEQRAEPLRARVQRDAHAHPHPRAHQCRRDGRRGPLHRRAAQRRRRPRGRS